LTHWRVGGGEKKKRFKDSEKTDHFWEWKRAKKQIRNFTLRKPEGKKNKEWGPEEKKRDVTKETRVKSLKKQIRQNQTTEKEEGLRDQYKAGSNEKY